ncbi:MAG: right-handed parallel beta-helix repeat-containing protein, partial [Lachnospiraceae bacterium]|nr:right-handed parallel beta-helix repeat-containing protein [Lachnospiraceae bacterium]
NGEAIQLEILSGTGNHFSGYNSDTDETICQDVEISGCKFLNLKRGVGSHTAITNSYFKNIQIHDNEFTNITGYAVSMLNYADSSVYNNVITNCGAGIFCSTIEKSHRNMYASLRTSNARTAPMVLNDKIYGNRITITTGANGAKYNNVNYGILVCGEKLKKTKGNVPAGDWRISGVTVEKNTIKITCTGYPIWLDGAVKNTIRKNKITCDIVEKGKGGVGDGIRLQGSTDNVIKSNTITNMRKKGPGAQMCGIKLIEKSDSNKIQKNTIPKVSKDGIHLEDSKKITITGNTIQKPGRDGIYAYKKQLKKEADNKVKGAKRYKKNIIVVKK